MNPILYPIKYDIPTERIMLQKILSGDFIKNLNGEAEVLKKEIEKIQNNQDTIDVWKSVYEVYLQRLEGNGSNNIEDLNRSGWDSLFQKLADPFTNFFLKLGYSYKIIDAEIKYEFPKFYSCLLYTSPSPRDRG